MKRYGAFLTFLLSFVVAGDLKAQTYPLSDFTEIILPKPNSPERAKIYKEGYDFVTSIRNGKLKIHEYTQKRGAKEVELIIANGKFVGTDKGEWGGKLLFVNTPYDTTIIKEGNIRFLFQYNHRNFFIESLSHLSINEGALYEIVFINDVYKYKKVLDFDDAPEVMCIVNGEILVASANNFYQIHELKKGKIFPDLLADDFFPRSLIAIDNRHVFMGVTAGYVQIDLIDRSYKFFQFNKGVHP